MGKRELSGRENWQTDSGKIAGKAELKFYDVFSDYFKESDFVVIDKPKNLKDIYSNITLKKEVLEKIYNPDISNKHWGVLPDFAIMNKTSGKILFVEVKNQAGWVEGKKPNDGRGNAHERGCKLFSPGLIRIFRKEGKIDESILPFWIIYQGDIARDPKRVREITCWFDTYDANFFLWHDSSKKDELINHFNTKLKQHLL